MTQPNRPPFMVGLCYPGGNPADMLRPFSGWLDMWRVIGIKALRVNAHWARPDVFEFLQFIADHGIRPWPIIDMTIPESNGAADEMLDRELPHVALFAERMVTRMPWITEVEIYNEPLSMGRLAPAHYARMCREVGAVIREVNEDVRILAGEVGRWHVERWHSQRAVVAQTLAVYERAGLGVAA